MYNFLLASSLLSLLNYLPKDNNTTIRALSLTFFSVISKRVDPLHTKCVLLCTMTFIGNICHCGKYATIYDRIISEVQKEM